ncbi:competence protein CoiA, partial [Streptococcus agalactiae]|nr:competence protein CoiA [Streptococcus agalactiae]MCK6330648.1 competence protein CoiA [Streptococcus agalactiae]
IGFHIWELDLRLEVLRLKYLIYEDLRGHVYYLSKTCPLSGDVLAFLKWPYQSKNLNFYKVKQDRNIRDYVRQQLRYGNQFWLRKQEKAYLSGQNLLTQELMMFFPQIQPPRVDTDFCQITNS